METRRDVFQAVADATRREILRVIAGKSPTVNSIAANFEVSRQAISLHIKVLAECGLIDIRKNGRERHCEPRLDKLNEVVLWVEQYRAYWERRPDVPEKHPEKVQRKKPGRKR